VVGLVGALLAYGAWRKGVGPSRRRHCRAALVGLLTGAAAAEVAQSPTIVALATLGLAGVVALGLLGTRLLRMSRGTWKPKPGAFDVAEPFTRRL